MEGIGGLIAMIRTWKTPGGSYSRLYNEFLHQTHFLIAGATGAGKSTVVNGMIHAALYKAPCDIGFIFIDPKGCELDEYKHLPHTIYYASELNDCVKALEYGMQLVKMRLADMKRKKIRIYDGSDIYIFIDELMILMTRVRKEVLPTMQDILSLARCTKIHLIACTQSPIAKVLPTELKCNFDSRLGLRTATSQDSRNIIGIKGCENFPNPQTDHKAFGYYRHGADMEVYNLPLIEDNERYRLIEHWRKYGKGKLQLFRR